MVDCASQVDTTPRLARWRIEALSNSTTRNSDLFKIGFWNWYLTVEKTQNQLCAKLCPEPSSITTGHRPIASVIIKIVYPPAPNRQTLSNIEFCDKEIKEPVSFGWAFDTSIMSRFIIDVVFLDLKTVPPSGGDPLSIWSSHHNKEQPLPPALTSLTMMLSESICTDITINSGNGSLRAHRAVLSARSPVFRTMFSHNLQEKELSTINIPDMSFDVCQVFLMCIYGNFHGDGFLTHRLDVFRAADLYDIADIKEACHESLLEDIDTKNVLERLQMANLYQLGRLKAACLRYLVNFGKIYEVDDDFNVFLQVADREIVAEIFREVLAVWKGL